MRAARSKYGDNTGKRKHKILIPSISAITVLVAVLCGWLSEKRRVPDSRQRKSSTDPCDVVIDAIAYQLGNNYVLIYDIDDVEIDEVESYRMREVYKGSELAKEHRWDDKFLDKHFIAVKVSYYVEYDHALTSLEDGDVNQYFYLIENENTGEWRIIDNTAAAKDLDV